MRKTFLVLLTLFVCSPFTLLAQRTEKWSGEYTYFGSLGETPEFAKQRALERLQVKAAEEVFGLSVTQTNITHANIKNGNSTMDFTSVGGSDVNGEWIETIGEPEYEVSIEKEFLVVKVKATGRVREIVSAPVDFSALLLRNGTEDKFQDADFKEGDDLFLSFSSPVAGYLAVYLIDDDGEAYCLLPYSNMQDGIFPIEANQRYVHFSPKHAPEGLPSALVEELYLTCDKPLEHNEVYIIFSPNKFIKVNDEVGGLDEDTNLILPRHLDNRRFHTWLAKCRKRDKEMRVDKRIITITK